MKKIIILTMMIAFVAVSFGQQAPASSPAQTQTDYLKKSKRQKTWAWVTTSVGTVITALTVIAESNPAYGEVPIIDNGEQINYTIAYILGFTCIATGIVLFVASGKNKKKANAASVFLDIKKAPLLQQTVFRNQSFPAVGVRISL